MMASRVQLPGPALSLPSPSATRISKAGARSRFQPLISSGWNRTVLWSSTPTRSPPPPPPLPSNLPCCSRSALQPLDLTEENVQQVLIDARSEFAQIFDASVGMTGEVSLAELDGPFVKLRLKGRFWHERSLVVARLGTYLKNRIPEILEVDIEDEKQLDDSPENF